MSTRTDKAYGRQGGRFLPDDYTPIPDEATAPRCEVCGGPMVCGQTGRHGACSPPAPCCGYPVDLIRDPKDHAKQHADPSYRPKAFR
jgi:hypothetical protein